MENAKRRMRAAFEMMSKLGVRYWTFHDRDIGQSCILSFLVPYYAAAF